MWSLLVKDVMDTAKALTVAPEATVSEVAALMAQRNTGAAMVVDRDSLVGIFTERDALYRVIAIGLNPEVTTMRQVMTPDPQTVEPNRSYGFALLVMQENHFRHVPVVKNGQVVGIVSSRNALDPDLEEFVSEANRREHIRAEG